MSLSSLQPVLLCHVAAVKRLLELHFSAVYIFSSFVILKLISGFLKIYFRINDEA